MKKNKCSQPAFKPAFKSSKPTQTKVVESIVPEKKESLKDIIDKFDCMPDNYDGDTDYESCDSSDKTLTEEQEH